MNNRCAFCDYDQIKEDILWESENFFVKVGKGILTPGHVLLISKKHFSCFGEMPLKFDYELNEIKRQVIDKIVEKFSEPILFEQGIHAQSINHAHIHILPTKSNEFLLPSALINKIFPELERMEVNEIEDIRKIFENEGQYIFFEEEGRKWVFHIEKNNEKEFAFRRELASINGNYEFAYWQNLSWASEKKNQEWIELTKQKLRF